MTLASAVALSLTGSGHLLVYQLGACRILCNSSSLQIQNVLGSSGGAIVATLMAFNFNLDDFSTEFIETGGRGLSLLQSRLEETKASLNGPALSICATQCRTGQLHRFDFKPGSNSHNPRLVSAVKASCHIPISFHPIDIVSASKSYGNSEGVQVDDDYYVDGGIAAPAPPWPFPATTEGTTTMNEVPSVRRIVISPITGQSYRGKDHQEEEWRISPGNTTDRSWMSINLNHNFRVNASIENLQALRNAIGATTASELKGWFNRGQEDAQRFEEKNLT